MGRLRGTKPSPAMVVAIVALVLAVAGTAVAGVATISVLTKKEKKQTRNIAKDEIKKAASGLSVAKASTSDALGGLGAEAFLRSDRVLSASANGTTVGTVLFSDPATGLEVRRGDQGVPLLVNTNAGIELVVNGIGWYLPGTLHGYQATIPPGNSVQILFDATGFSYANLMVVKRVSDGSTAPRLQLTCAFKDAPTPAQVVMSCVGVR